MRTGVGQNFLAPWLTSNERRAPVASRLIALIGHIEWSESDGIPTNAGSEVIAQLAHQLEPLLEAARPQCRIAAEPEAMGPCERSLPYW
jgi:hypothetical protein